MASVIRMQGITKRFPGVVANDNVSLDVQEGEIHALLGENGAGKSTLMNILSGIYKPDEGEIFLRDQPLVLHSPRDAIRSGIWMIHQHFRLVEAFSVAENLILGSDKLPAFYSKARVRRDIARLSEQNGLEVDPDAAVWQLSVGEQQRVEILKAIYRGARVLVLD
nr:ATP-binding cassette domain-containing protein [bacterium]